MRSYTWREPWELLSGNVAMAGPSTEGLVCAVSLRTICVPIEVRAGQCGVMVGPGGARRCTGTPGAAWTGCAAFARATAPDAGRAGLGASVAGTGGGGAVEHAT